MPTLGTWSWLSWIGVIIGQLAVTGILMRSGQRCCFPGITSFVAWRSAISLALLGITLFTREPHRSWWYFYTYYAGAAVACVLEYIIICNFATLFISTDGLRLMVRSGLRYMGAAFFVGSALFSFRSPLPFDEWIVQACVGASRSISLAWLAVFLCILFLASSLHLSWPQRSLGMAIGYAFASVGEVAHDWLLGVFRTQYLSDTRAVFYLACLVTWTVTLSVASRTSTARP